MQIGRAANRAEQVQGIGENQRGIGDGRIERIGQQVVVEKVYVPPEAGAEGVPFVLVGAQAGGAVGVAAVTEAGDKEIIEEQSLVVERAQRERLLVEARAGVQIDKSVVDGGIASWLRDPPA